MSSSILSNPSENLQFSFRSSSSPSRLHFTIFKGRRLAWNRLSFFSSSLWYISYYAPNSLFKIKKCLRQSSVEGVISYPIARNWIFWFENFRNSRFNFFRAWNFSKFQILKSSKMSNDRNSRLYRARDSVQYGRNSAYGRSSVQSGNKGQTGRSSLSPGRTSSGLSPVRDTSSVSQRTSTMAVVNPPSTNSNNRRRYFNRGLLEHYGFWRI